LIRFDEESHAVTLSVRDLADDGDYRFSGPTPLSLRRRAVLGRLAHEDHQDAREVELSSYRRERGVTYETTLDGWRATVQGRIDGIYTDPQGRTVIEEVKTIVGGAEALDDADEETFPAYTRQLQLYRFLLEEGSRALGFSDDAAPEIALHLCLIALPSREVRVLELTYDAGACRDLVARRLREIIAARGERRRRVARRQAARAQVRFPHPELRPQQAAMMEAIEAALEQGRRILVSAPPGIGKTAAALVPALRHACAIGGRVFVATSKTTQQAMFAKTVALIRAAGAPVRAVVLSAKSKVCLNDVVHCHPDACAHARDYPQKLAASGAVERLLALPVADRDALQAEGRAHAFCPFEAALDLTAEVDVVIGDYNYVFDPGAALKRMFVERDPDDVVLVIDEAHNLYERGRAYYSPSLDRLELADIDRRLAGLTNPVARRVRGIVRRIAEHVEAIARGDAGQAPPPEPEPADGDAENMLLFDDPQAQAKKKARRTSSARLRPPEPRPRRPDAAAEVVAPERVVHLDRSWLTAARDELTELSVAWFAEGRSGFAGEEQDPVVQANRLVSRFVGVLELGGGEFSCVASRLEGDSLRILCKDPSRQLGRRIAACAGAVAVSATLEPLAFYRDVLGFDPHSELRSFPSPFDPARRRVIVLDRPATTYRERERDLPIVDGAVRAVLASRPGNYLVCCPSFDYLRKLAESLEGIPRYELIRQTPAMSEGARQEVLARLRATAAERRSPVLLLTVQGGIFTEGVDYPGEQCVGAIVVGPGLPRVSFSRELIQGHFERAYGRGFEYAYLYPGMAKVVQAAGRVIRTTSDEGVIVLVGSRFATRRYADLFPRDWYGRSPDELVCADPYKELRGFWSGRAEASRGSGETPAPRATMSAQEE
jgi:DNA excision repair protein ERCC-2